MKRIFLLISIFFFQIIPVCGSTVATDVSVDTVWSVSQSPYLLQGFIIIEEESTLTIDPGVIVKASPGAFILVRGKLVVGNTVGNPVVFTSAKDDESGGDTNNDGNGSAPTSKDWDGIQFDIGSEGIFRNAVIQYAGANLAGIINDGGTLSFSGATLRDNFNRAVWQKRGDLDITQSHIEGGLFGVYVDSGRVSIFDTTFKNINEHGISAFNIGNVYIENTNFDQVKIPGAISAGVDFYSKETEVIGGTKNGFLRFGATSGNHIWKGGDLPYVIHFLEIASDTSLTLQDGLILKLDQNELIVSRGNFTISGTEEKPIVITSLLDDLFGGDTNMDGSSSAPEKGDWNMIQFDSGSVNQFSHVSIRFGGTNIYTPEPRSAIVQYGGELYANNIAVSSNYDSAFTIVNGLLDVTSSRFENNHRGVVVRGGDVSIVQSVIVNNDGSGIENIGQNVVEARNNWWGSETGPFHPDFNPDGQGEEIYGNVHFDPWLLTDGGEEQVEQCCSNVAFLPGIGGSRLYRPGLLGEDRIWEPNGFNDMDQIMLATSTGASLLQDIYAKDLVDETLIRVDEWPGTNTYGTFAQYMDTELVQSEVIHEWKPLVYDWRLGLFDVVTGGKVLSTEEGVEKISYLSATTTGYIIQELNRLADSSLTGKVTIVTHSNGGLVAKYLIKYLQDTHNPLLQKIDKLVLVAVPQLGTPEAVAVLLHGTTPVGKGVSRSVSEDMKSAYHLLPSRKYFETVISPLFTFSNDIIQVDELKDLAGNVLATYADVRDFMTGRSGRWSDPSSSDIDTPNVLDEALLDYADQIHNALDEFVIPESIQVTQIAGVGIDTVRGIAYDDCDVFGCADTLNHLDRELLRTKRGDGTVVLPSAVLSDTGVVYVDLEENNDATARNRKHGSIFEVSDLQKTLKSIIKNENIQFTDVITNEEPAISSNDTSFSFTLHSPLSLHLYDSDGRHTGLVDSINGIRYAEENIPNSYYREFGEVKYAGVSSDNPVVMKLVGENRGTFTLEVEKTNGDIVLESIVFEDVPVVAGMLVTIPPVSPDTLIENTQLSIDIDANGTIDTVIDQGSGISQEEWIGFLKGYINKLTLTDKKKDKLQKILVKLERIIEKEKGCENKKKKEKCEFRLKVRSGVIEARFLLVIERFYKRGLVTLDELNQIKDIIKIKYE